MVESDELALDASVAPGGILAGHLEYQRPDRLWGGWAAGLASRVGPAAGDELGVPTQQGSRRHQPNPAQTRGQQPAQGAEDGPVDPLHRRAGWVDAARRPRDGARGSRRPWLHPTERATPASSTDGREPGMSRKATASDHAGPPATGNHEVGLAEKALVKGRDTVLGTHRHKRRAHPRMDLHPRGAPRSSALGSTTPTGCSSPAGTSIGTETVPTYRPGDVRTLEKGRVLVVHANLPPIQAQAVDVSARPDWAQLRADIDAVRRGDLDLDTAGFAAPTGHRPTFSTQPTANS